MSKRFDICTPRPKRDGGTWWHKIGSAWQSDRGLITCYLDSVPVPSEDSNGKFSYQFSLFEPREETKKPYTPARKESGEIDFNKELDDEIPL